MKNGKWVLFLYEYEHTGNFQICISVPLITLCFLHSLMLLYFQAFNVDQLSELNTAQIKAIEPNIRNSLPPAKAQALVAVESEEGVQNPGSTGKSLCKKLF